MPMSKGNSGAPPTKSQQGQAVKPAYQAYNQYKYGKKGQSGAVSKNSSGGSKSY